MLNICLIVSFVLIILKLSGAIVISWAWVTFPVWGLLALYLVIKFFQLLAKTMESDL